MATTLWQRSHLLGWHKWAPRPGGAVNVQHSVTFLMRLPVALIAAASLVSLAAPNAAHALTWNWSFQVNDGSSGSGTFTTASTTAVANQDEVITGATGTYIRSAGSAAGTYSITGINSFISSTPAFRWDGTPGSAIINSINFSIYLQVGVKFVGIYYDGENFAWGAIDTIITDFPDNDGIITSSTLTPQTAPQGVPGPLSLFGAGAAFGWSRRLRRRVKSGSVPTSSSLKTASLPSVLSPLA